jgi:hypothetical protein
VVLHRSMSCFADNLVLTCNVSSLFAILQLYDRELILLIVHHCRVGYQVNYYDWFLLNMVSTGVPSIDELFR